jgi:hypothetical protein
MILKKEYITKLKDIIYFMPISQSGIFHLSDNSKGNLYENITRIDFNSLYANIQIGLFNGGLIGEEWKDDIERVQWFLKNRTDLKRLSPGEYQKWKIHCNSLYDKIRSPYVVEYLDMFYTDLIQKYGDLIIHADVDTLYLNINKGDKLISEINDFSYDIQYINYFYIEERSRYIEQEESGTTNFGHRCDISKKDYLSSITKRELRKRKLEKLGI